jgi:hypothetical protein
MRKLLCLLLLGLCGCSEWGPKATAPATVADKAQDLIVGRWEGDTGGVEFTAAGSVIIPGPRPELGSYRFLDNTTIEMMTPGKLLRLTNVQVNSGSLSFMVMGRGKATYHRVKEYSAKVLHGGRVPPTRKGQPAPSGAKAPDGGKAPKDKPATPGNGS